MSILLQSDLFTGTFLSFFSFCLQPVPFDLQCTWLICPACVALHVVLIAFSWWQWRYFQCVHHQVCHSKNCWRVSFRSVLMDNFGITEPLIVLKVASSTMITFLGKCWVYLYANCKMPCNLCRGSLSCSLWQVLFYKNVTWRILLALLAKISLNSSNVWR